MFGLSTLRKNEAEKDTTREEQGRVSDKAVKLQEYLSKQYGDGSHSEKQRKKKKKRKVAAKGAIAIVDHDDAGFKPVEDSAKIEEEDGTSSLRILEFSEIEISIVAVWVLMGHVRVTSCADGPVVANLEEFDRSKRQEEREKEMMEKRGGDGGWKVVDSAARGKSVIEAEIEASPPRRQRMETARIARHDDENGGEAGAMEEDIDASPPRRRARHDSDSEGDEEEDASPPRRQRMETARIARHDDENGGEAGAMEEDIDASPPRRRARPAQPIIDSGKLGKERMSDGTRTGMISGKEISREMELKRQHEAERFRDLDDSVTGRTAKTVYRTAEGRVVSREEYVEAKEAKRKKYQDAADLPWGKGMKQTMGQHGKDDLSKRDADRFGDPMAHLIKKDTSEENIQAPSSLLDRHEEVLRKAGFIIPLEIPKHSWLRRKVGAPPNRFGIKPGRHWDGVDRSNGFERDMFKRKNELRRREQEARMWAQEDM